MRQKGCETDSRFTLRTGLSVKCFLKWPEKLFGGHLWPTKENFRPVTSIFGQQTRHCTAAAHKGRQKQHDRSKARTNRRTNLELHGNRTSTEGIPLTRKASTNPGKKPCRKKSMQLRGSSVRYPTKVETGRRHDPLGLPSRRHHHRRRQKRNNVISPFKPNQETCQTYLLK